MSSDPTPSTTPVRPQTNARALFRAMGYLRPHAWMMLGAFFGLLVSTAANLLAPQLLRVIVDDGILARNLSVIGSAGAGLVALALARGAFEFLQAYLAEAASQNVAYDLRNVIFNKITTLSFSYHDQQQTGQLMTRVTSDVELVRQFLGQAMLRLLGAAIVLIGALVFLLRMNALLTLVMMLVLPAFLGLLGRFLRFVRPLFNVTQQKLAELNTVLQENLAGIRVVRAFAREPFELQRYTRVNTELKDISIRINNQLAITFPLLFFVVNAATLLVVLAGGLLVIDAQLTVGELVAFTNYLAVLIQPMFAFGFLSAFVARASVSAERIFEVIDAESEVKEKPGAVRLPPIQGRVEFRNVWFKFAGADRWALQDVSFVVEPGTKVAVVGRTGSGKSSIVNLIPRFYDPQRGQVLIDGYDVKDVTLDSLRGNIGVVLQDAVLFSGTIRENIAYGKPDATMEEIIAAAKAAQAHDFIMQFPDGYETIIGERGVGLSGGQKQRIAIARALLLKPRLIILDDSTSAVDAETEYQIQKALETMLSACNCTSFVIAQRLSSVRNADLILLVDEGRIVAQGTHEDLLRESALYGEILDTQFAPDLVEDAAEMLKAEVRA
ncbi:MAG: ABC transporter ATP-binding protein/permease [Thermoflexales bacterium]|nr:ABC transporter ATP-binding protein/permease [Thermoflexales bacterium]MCS7325617.1 ABC transporter ATP-binding protein/permease [Thermoflexales bacterium]MCX7938899.1 ABC transporter ATP-binding protein/permease [Thermoflexales bacterium]MDW8054364.1 ABC transporter ATP-binding protein [Anaerolineae bacterium]MDW8291474.1 ABC transporter ATP-binding protein [Anaerolineae bacterium]